MTKTEDSGRLIEVVSHLVSLGRLDTLYRDQYLLRAGHYYRGNCPMTPTGA